MSFGFKGLRRIITELEKAARLPSEKAFNHNKTQTEGTGCSYTTCFTQNNVHLYNVSLMMMMIKCKFKIKIWSQINFIPYAIKLESNNEGFA
jgi:hypothetical protein